MKLDLIVVTPKKLNKVKVVGAISILVIIILSIVMTIYAKKIKNEEMQSILRQQSVFSNEKKTKTVHEIITTKVPRWTEDGTNNFKNIYNYGEKRAYLTFDDGPSQTVTPLILNLLGEYNIKVNFFVLGSRVDLYPGIVKRAYDEGHYIANHGYSHVYKYIYQNKESILGEYDNTEISIRNAINVPEYFSHVFRFPGGSTGGSYHNIKEEAKGFLEENKALYLDWNCLTNDSSGSRSKEDIINTLVATSTGKNNLVILMHDAGDKYLTYESLPDVITYLLEQGYTFHTFYDLLK